MRSSLINDLLWHLDADGSLKVGKCPEAASQRLEKMPLPLEVKRMLQWNWTNAGGKVGDYSLDSVEEALACDELPRLLTARMFPIGSARNGDRLVLRFSEDRCAVGLVNHEDLWDEERNLDEAYVEVTGSVDEYLWRASEKRYLSIDYYAASELAAMRRDMAGTQEQLGDVPKIKRRTSSAGRAAPKERGQIKGRKSGVGRARAGAKTRREGGTAAGGKQPRRKRD